MTQTSSALLSAQSTEPAHLASGLAMTPSDAMDPRGKYRPYLSYLPVHLADRKWPEKQISIAPTWCSVDLRDGNQALIRPMGFDQKLLFFQLLKRIGFKEIEIGFPSANDVEFGFARHLIEGKLLGPDVWPQVLTQARASLIRKTFEAIAGAERAIVHVYNPTSEQQRRIVYRTDAAGVRATAVGAVQLIRQLSADMGVPIALEYSPESFTGTELRVSLDVCNAVIAAWEPGPNRPLIINLPATVELSTPNVYADQIEWFCRNVDARESLSISLHTHNDRGTAIAATELGLLAGADRVEGTLFGNGERTGNVDIVTLAMNLYSQGINPQLDLRDITQIVRTVSECNNLPVHPRHPYAGQLVFTAFSGSHQFAIDRGLTHRSLTSARHWDVPYLPIDPTDIGRDYEADAIRINNQSGGYGVAHVLRTQYDWHLPKAMTREFTDTVVKSAGNKDITDELGARFRQEYILREHPFAFVDFTIVRADANEVHCCLTVDTLSERKMLHGFGKSQLHACRDALLQVGCLPFEVVSFHKHSTNTDADQQSIAYVQIETRDRRRRFGAGIDINAGRASAKAILSAINRASEIRKYPLADCRKAMEAEYHCRIPADMEFEFEACMSRIPNTSERELPATVIWEAFCREFVEPEGPIRFVSVKYKSSSVEKRLDAPSTTCVLQISVYGEIQHLEGTGGGTIEACVNAIQEARLGEEFGKIEIAGDGYHAATTGENADVPGIAFVNISVAGRGKKYGVGIDVNTTKADVRAVISAVNRTLQHRPQSSESFSKIIYQEFGFGIPEGMRNEFNSFMYQRGIRGQQPLSVKWVWDQFASEFIDRVTPYEFKAFQWHTCHESEDVVKCELLLQRGGVDTAFRGVGVGTLDAAKDAIIKAAEDQNEVFPTFRLLDFEEHSMGAGTNARAIAFVSISINRNAVKYGVGIDSDTTLARVKALVAAINRSYRRYEYSEHELFEAMRTEFGYELPEEMYAEFTDSMKSLINSSGDPVPTRRIWERFSEEYVDRNEPFSVVSYNTVSDSEDSSVDVSSFAIRKYGESLQLSGRGRNAVAAFHDALTAVSVPTFEIHYIGEHSIFKGTDECVAYVQIETPEHERFFGIGTGPNSDHASVRAVVSALNRLLNLRKPL